MSYRHHVEGITRGFTEFDMNSLSVSVSIFYCVPISFVLETDTEIDREFISNFENFTSENRYFRELVPGLEGANRRGFN